MLISFSLSNYRSVRDSVQLNLLPSKGCKELPENVFMASDKTGVLRTAVIYGANASGKSNILKGFVDFIEFILNSSSNKLKDKITIYDPFLLDTTSENQPTGFKIECLINEIKYDYEVTLHDVILSETLYYYPKGQRVLVFDRAESESIKFGSVLKGEKKSIEARLLPNQLFLSKGANENQEFLKGIYNYFSSYDAGLYFALNSLFEIAPLTSIIALVLKEKDEDFKTRLLHIIKSFDIGIQSFDIIDAKQAQIAPGVAMTDIIRPDLMSKMSSSFQHEIITTHALYDKQTDTKTTKSFTFDKESAGTRNLFLMALRVLEVLDKGSVIVVDEFERSLHPMIVQKLIRIFHNEDINRKSAQLVFSTHNISLLDNELFRRDQIWFTEKDERGNTEFFALSQIDGVRNTVPYDKWYMSGRFGATPILQEPIL